MNKVLTSDSAFIIRACFAEDLDLLSTFNTNVALGLDAAVNDSLAAISDNARFYKLEIFDGALMGWIAIDPASGTIDAWYIRKQCRLPDLLTQFNLLVFEIFAYKFFNSTGIVNFDPSNLPVQNNLQITIPTLDYTGKNVVILNGSN